jgi:nicotianamine synthase
VYNVDRDTSALQVSESLCKLLGYGDRMSFACEDITEESPSSKPDWQSCQVVLLAALVGTDTYAKLNILKSMAKKLMPGTLVVARSAQGMRSVLYPVSLPQMPL